MFDGYLYYCKYCTSILLLFVVVFYDCNGVICHGKNNGYNGDGDDNGADDGVGVGGVGVGDDVDCDDDYDA